VKIVFFGTADFACPALRRLAQTYPFEVVGVVTQPDRPKGRGGKMAATPVKLAALDLHCKVFQPDSLKSPPFLAQLKYMKPDFIVVAAYGKILHREILDAPDMGCFNIHASLLPKYRGAAPIQRAIMDGCDETGITIMRMDEGLDTGDMVLQRSTHIRETDNVQTLHDRLAEIGAELTIEALNLASEGKAKFIPQENKDASYAQKITREDELILWDTSKRHIWNQIRALYPGPGAYSYLMIDKTPKMVKLLVADFERFTKGEPGKIIQIDKRGIHVASDKGALVIKELQLEGKKKTTAEEFLNGYPLRVGQKFLPKPSVEMESKN
jgi:methionyl-tRNA formyltransferase